MPPKLTPPGSKLDDAISRFLEIRGRNPYLGEGMEEESEDWREPGYFWHPESPRQIYPQYHDQNPDPTQFYRVKPTQEHGSTNYRLSHQGQEAVLGTPDFDENIYEILRMLHKLNMQRAVER